MTVEAAVVAAPFLEISIENDRLAERFGDRFGRFQCATLRARQQQVGAQRTRCGQPGPKRRGFQEPFG